MDISEYMFDNGGETDFCQWTHDFSFHKSDEILIRNHRLSIRRVNKDGNNVYQVYRQYNYDESEQVLYEGNLECAISTASSQMKIFHEKMESKKYYHGPDNYAELGRLGFLN